ncbi:hypothetical protein BDZ89DRAFT_1233283 [Hymenopellis radicata]|nr:hypothetical protein BDZ89DRAFT_1233283 [Hymenopellis radicata]
MREEFGTELARVREDHHSELSRLKEERDQEKADIQARYRREEEKAYQEKMSVHELKNDSANKDLKITQLHKEREKDRADVDGLNMALESKQQELELIKRKIGGVGTAGATPVRPTTTHASQQRRQSSMVTPRSRPSSVISDSSGGRDIDDLHPPGTSTSSKPQRSSVEGSMGPPPDQLRASLNGAPNIASRISSLNRSTARPTSTASPASTASSASSSTPHRRMSSLATERTLAKAKAAPTTAPVSETTTDSEYDHEKENLKQSRTKIPAAA